MPVLGAPRAIRLKSVTNSHDAVFEIKLTDAGSSGMQNPVMREVRAPKGTDTGER
jgi:hypothetical protein